jgi:phosphatidylserine/phosphatidylglycerophosphate/cardiolipin synthase-like enzyme
MRHRLGLQALIITVFLLIVALPSQATITIYYSDPTVAAPSSSRKLDLQVMNFIKAAKHSLDIAVYNMTHPHIADSIIAAHRRGVRVRMVCEDANWNDLFQRCQDAGITVVRDNNPVHMHHKFIVRDSNAVLTGSYNFTVSGTRNDKNTIVVLKSTPSLAALYTAEFEQMFVRRRFGTNKALQASVTAEVAGFPVRVYFSPRYGRTTERIVTEINKADTAIYMSAYVITDKQISDALIAARKRGVKVYIAMDKRQSESQSWSRHNDLIAGGCLVRFSKIGGFLHDKTLVIDPGYNADAIAIIGSFNFTNQANDQNDENILFIERPATARSMKTAAYASYTKLAE